MTRLLIRPSAHQDISEIIAWLLAEAGPSVAERFMREFREGNELLRRTPRIGSRYQRSAGKAIELRRWRIGGFPLYHLFYLIRGNDVVIVRVLHSSRDVGEIMESNGDDFGDSED